MTTSLLIIDERGFQALDRRNAHLLFKIINYRYERGSTLITSNKSIRDWPEMLAGRYGRRATLVASQLPFDHWHQIIQDATFAVHNTHKIILKGASMRRTKKPGEVNDNH